MLVIRDEVVSVKQKDPTKPESKDGVKPSPRDKPEPKKAQVEKNTKTALGNRRIHPMPKQQGRAISDAILIFSRF
jgi:hypothetical protein